MAYFIKKTGFRNKIAGVILLLCVAFFNSVAQDRIFLGMDGGLAIFKTKVKNIEGNNFTAEKVYSFAPTGFNINIETGVDWSVEFGISEQSFVTEHVSYVDNDDGFTISGGATTASSIDFKIKRTISLGERFTLFPFLGFTRVNLNQRSGYIGDYYKINSGSSTVNGVVTRDSTFTQYNYKSNVISGPEVGLEIAYRLSRRLNICFNATYFFNTEDFTMQGVDYFKDGQSARSAIIYYGGDGVFLQLGVKWNWRDMVKPGTYSLKSN